MGCEANYLLLEASEFGDCVRANTALSSGFARPDYRNAVRLPCQAPGATR